MKTGQCQEREQERQRLTQRVRRTRRNHPPLERPGSHPSPAQVLTSVEIPHHIIDRLARVGQHGPAVYRTSPRVRHTVDPLPALVLVHLVCRDSCGSTVGLMLLRRLHVRPASR